MVTTSLPNHLAKASAPMQDGLQWFLEVQGTEIDWPSPSPVASLPHLVTAAKGIYKPEGEAVALSVCQRIGSPYADRPVLRRQDGTWAYGYHQEGDDPDPTTEFTNRALLANMQTETPVAVLIQTSRQSPVRYRVEGLALVTHYEDGFFYLEGFSPHGLAHPDGVASRDALVAVDAEVEVAASQAGQVPLDPSHDARVRSWASIVRRQGQGAFRSALIEAYGGCCAISGCDVATVLDAAHVLPYRGARTNALSNGLLLRTDLHTLLDKGMLAIDPTHRTVIVADSLSGSDYWTYQGASLSEPADPLDRVSVEVLQAHLSWCGERLRSGSSPSL